MYHIKIGNGLKDNAEMCPRAVIDTKEKVIQEKKYIAALVVQKAAEAILLLLKFLHQLKAPK